MSAYSVGTTCLLMRVISGPQNVDKEMSTFFMSSDEPVSEM